MFYFPKIKICINVLFPQDKNMYKWLETWSLISRNASTRWNMERVYVWKPSLLPGNASTRRNMEKGWKLTLLSGNASTGWNWLTFSLVKTDSRFLWCGDITTRKSSTAIQFKIWRPRESVSNQTQPIYG